MRASLFLFVFLVNAAFAAPDTNVYANQIFFIAPLHPIYLVDINTGGLTLETNMPYPAASRARSPVTGLLYYTEYNVFDGRVGTSDPDTDTHEYQCECRMGHFVLGEDAMKSLTPDGGLTVLICLWNFGT